MARYFCNWRMLWPSTGPMVAEAKFLEEHAAHQAGLHRVLDLVQEPLHRIAETGTRASIFCTSSLSPV